VTEEIRELAALYALGALTQHEARSFEIHLHGGCPVCKSELSRLEHAAAGIGLAAEEMETPEYLRDLLLARIEREPQVSVSTPLPDPGEKKPARDISPPLFASLNHSSKPKIRPYKKILCIAIFLFPAIFYIYMIHDMRMQNAQLQTRLSASEMEVDHLQKDLDAQKKKPEDFSHILEVAGKPGMRIAWLVGQSPAPSSSGTLFWDTKQHRYLLMGSFPSTPQGKAYQLWIVTPEKKVSAGMIKMNSNGTTYTTAPIPEDLPDATAVGITLELESGSPTPTTNFCARGHFN
jgi:hypothetical protein